MPDGPIVCNTGPLIALANAHCLHLLNELYGRVLVPTAVLDEIGAAGSGRHGAREVASAPGLEKAVLESPPDALLAAELGRGEAEVIALASRLQARLVLIDERRARRIAEHAYGLNVKGSAGILVAAKRVGLISAVRPHLQAMLERGYYLSPRLISFACEAAGESTKTPL